MSAVFKTIEAGFEPMTEARLDEVVAIERRAYDHPGPRQLLRFAASGYRAQLLCADERRWATSWPCRASTRCTC
jgi:ribosomal-protein-alanine N-acetyltransferase